MSEDQTNQFILNIGTSLDKDTSENVIISKLCGDIYENYAEMNPKLYIEMLSNISKDESNNTYTRLMAVLMTHYELLKQAMITKNDTLKSAVLDKMQSVLCKIDIIG